MKVDKTNPRHWAYLVVFGINVLGAILLRRIRRRSRQRPLAVLYGHKLNGNLLAIYRWLRHRPESGIDVVFLSLDPEYSRALVRAGEASIAATGLRCMTALADAAVVISDHGLHAMQPLLRFSDIRFVDVWHGIPFKGFDADDFRVQHGYHEIWVASALQRTLYLTKFGFAPERVHVTGYARTDRLVIRQEDPLALRRAFGLPETGKIVLFAPTWAQDARGRSLYPFGCDQDRFLLALSAVASRYAATLVVRTHLNSGSGPAIDYPHVRTASARDYPDTEGLLLVSDALICDWSSIAFDFLLLGRPALFLEVPAPFSKGFSLTPEFRYGAVVDSLEALCSSLAQALGEPQAYWAAHGDRHRQIAGEVYGGAADGKAAGRCAERLRALAGTAGR